MPSRARRSKTNQTKPARRNAAAATPSGQSKVKTRRPSVTSASTSRVGSRATCSADGGVDEVSGTNGIDRLAGGFGSGSDTAASSVSPAAISVPGDSTSTTTLVPLRK